jgi:selenocysteine-specific elongation factor
MKRIIVGTAGHIDHGKTALVKALTGIDADRLKEEKERGITIDIGFADLVSGGIHFGFVDVPGHERFVRNMLAGAHGIDLVILVVAADEGVMPQTREHFDICRLLEVKAGLVAITKADLADEELLQLVEAEVEEFVAGSFLAGRPVLRVSAQTLEGIEALKAALIRLAAEVGERDEHAVPRLPIDRVFTIKGFGTVVTGTLIAGRINGGDEMEVIPSAGRRTRARGLQVHNKSVREARAGERTAINLQGVEVAEISRGQTLAPAGRLAATSMIDVRLQLLKTAPRELRTRSRVRLHIGTAEVLARVVLLGAPEIKPGDAGYAQLRLESPTLALPGDHFIIRRHSPAVTIGGGLVIDGLPAKHHSRDGARVIATLEGLAAADAIERLARLVEMEGASGLNFSALAARSGLPDAEIARAVETLARKRRLTVVSANPLRIVAHGAFEELARRVRVRLREHHQRAPLAAGLGREELRERVFAHLHADIFRAVVNQLVERGEVIAERDLLRLSSHRIELSADDQAAKDHLAGLYDRAALQPLPLTEAISQTAQQFGIDAARAQRFAQMLINGGELVKVADLVFHRRALDSLRQTLLEHKAERGPRLDVGAFKDLTGVSRKYAIPLLEYLDRQRVTRRIGDGREII